MMSNRENKNTDLVKLGSFFFATGFLAYITKGNLRELHIKTDEHEFDYKKY